LLGLRTFVLERNGEPVRELTVNLNGRLTTFHFPHSTSDPGEIEYLIRKGATVKRPPAVLKSRTGQYRKSTASKGR
jgi:hypothetical protein